MKKIRIYLMCTLGNHYVEKFKAGEVEEGQDDLFLF